MEDKLDSPESPGTLSPEEALKLVEDAKMKKKDSPLSEQDRLLGGKDNPKLNSRQFTAGLKDYGYTIS